MTNFELIDDYLTNRLGEQEKLEFERQLGSDPALKADVDLQKHILEGVKQARIADLKAFLNNVPVGGSLSSGVATGKIAAAVITTGIIATSLYFYFKPKEQTSSEQPQVNKTIEPSVKKPDSVVVVDKGASTRAQTAVAEPIKEKKKALKNKETAKPATQPKIEVTDPSDELVESTTKGDSREETRKSRITNSHIAVETNANIKKYNFHYQFKDGKLVLYGTFDKSLYEILEIHGDSHAIFLYYKETYYLLNEKQTQIVKLEPIKDAVLLKKLKEYRGR